MKYIIILTLSFILLISYTIAQDCEKNYDAGNIGAQCGTLPNRIFLEYEDVVVDDSTCKSGLRKYKNSYHVTYSMAKFNIYVTYTPPTTNCPCPPNGYECVYEKKMKKISSVFQGRTKGDCAN